VGSRAELEGEAKMVTAQEQRDALLEAWNGAILPYITALEKRYAVNVLVRGATMPDELAAAQEAVKLFRQIEASR
jgi:hypothetical protein